MHNIANEESLQIETASIQLSHSHRREIRLISLLHVTLYTVESLLESRTLLRIWLLGPGLHSSQDSMYLIF